MGGIAAGADDATLAALSEYGMQVGLAFQGVDDLLTPIQNGLTSDSLDPNRGAGEPTASSFAEPVGAVVGPGNKVLIADAFKHAQPNPNQ